MNESYPHPLTTTPLVFILKHCWTIEKMRWKICWIANVFIKIKFHKSESTWYFNLVIKMSGLIQKDSTASAKSESNLFLILFAQTVVEKGHFVEYYSLANFHDRYNWSSLRNKNSILILSLLHWRRNDDFNKF